MTLKVSWAEVRYRKIGGDHDIYKETKKEPLQYKRNANVSNLDNTLSLKLVQIFQNPIVKLWYLTIVQLECSQCIQKCIFLRANIFIWVLKNVFPGFNYQYTPLESTHNPKSFGRPVMGEIIFKKKPRSANAKKIKIFFTSLK